MDIYCPRCSEPWDTDEFHDIADEQETTYDEVRKNFRAKGCQALGMRPCAHQRTLRGDATSALMDMLGDDLDGVASLLDDFGYAGMLD